MLRRIAVIAIIAGAFCGGMYTTTGCGTSPTEVPLFGTLRGTVTNAQTGAALSSVNISATTHNAGNFASTDAAGHYELMVPAGSVQVNATKTGFQSFTRTINIQSDTVTTLDIALQPGQ